MDRLKKIYLILTASGAFFGTIAITRSYLSGDKYRGNEELYGKTVIITGGNRGIGKETARDLAKRGARVILACRDIQSCTDTKNEIVKETFNKNVECMYCDLASLKSIKEFADSINKNEKFVNILVNNAGTMWNRQSYTKDGFETQFGVNHLGHFYLTKLILPKLISSVPSRIVVLSSKDHLKGDINFEDLNGSKKYDEEKAYNQSKLANVLFTMELSDRLKDTNVTANCVDPGYTQTDLMRHSSIHKSPYSPISFFFKTFLKSSFMGAQSVIFACVSNHLDQVSGKCIKDFTIMEPSTKAQDKEVAKRLWAVSEKWIDSRVK